ncbi:MAG: molecular chaperone TorD family protein [Chloroflexi bacterium]|nr:molecular chaperone TorD family protein [Chloroflexota bacterium]
MNEIDFAVARHRTYALLGQLYLEGVTAASTSDLQSPLSSGSTFPTLQSIPELAETLPNTFDADEAAAEYQTLFGFNVFPYESIFVDESGLLGGAATDAALTSYRQAGFSFGDSSASADHIGHELGLLAHLCGAEADALADDLPLVAERMRDLQRDFLQKHLLRWILPFALAVRGQERPFYAALADLTLEFISDHVSGIGIPKTQPLENFGNWNSRNIPNLQDDKTSLKDIVEYLTTPPHSGIYLGRDDVARLAQRQNLPRGFGDRTQMLINLLRSAAQYDLMPNLLADLEEVAKIWADEYGRFSPPSPLFPYAKEWQTRASHTRQLLQEIQLHIETTT